MEQEVNCILYFSKKLIIAIIGALQRMANRRIPGVPFFLRGVVIKGFGRGGKELGCPTANFSEEVVAMVPTNTANGIYYGFAQG